VTTTLQIEQRLSSLNGACFQRLCDAFLRQRGIESYISIGLTLGSDKTRTGTPDSLAGDAEGHTFVEVTTQAKGLGAKLGDDLGKCLDPEKTGVPIARIRRIYLFFTGYLDAAEVEALYALTRPHGVELILYGPQALADDLRYRFASLAQEYLDLAIDTGQVLDPETFVQRHSRTALQTDLDARFVGRALPHARCATACAFPRATGRCRTCQQHQHIRSPVPDRWRHRSPTRDEAREAGLPRRSRPPQPSGAGPDRSRRLSGLTATRLPPRPGRLVDRETTWLPGD
jgi:hypothetical protein